MALFGPTNRFTASALDGAARPHGTGESYGTAGAATVVNSPLSPMTGTPRRTRVQPNNTTRLSPMQHASPRHVRTQPAEPRSGSQASSRVTGMTQGIRLPVELTPSSSTTPRHLPVHYFTPNPIVTPDELSATLKRAPDGPHFVITQGIEPGIYREWYISPFFHFWLLTVCPGIKWLPLRKMFQVEFGRKRT